MARRNQNRPSRSARIALASLNDEQRLIAGLDPLTHRKLAENPPAPSETMQDIGISATNLDTVVRSWINRAFRAPRGLPPLISGDIKSGTKWSKLLEMCG